MLTSTQPIKQNASKPVNLSQTTKSGSARFVMGLNNRVVKLDKRISRLELLSNQLEKRQLGYKELIVTFLVALLAFTSTVLAIGQLNSAQFQGYMDQATSLLASTQTPVVDTPKSFYAWPLEKQKKSSDIEYNRFGQGIIIHAKLGDPVVAIDAGKVIYSDDRVSDYGNLILIQHKDELISVYGFNYSNYVKEGQYIKQGELIAAAGEGNGKQPGLYFEVRHQGKPQDPFIYLAD